MTWTELNLSFSFLFPVQTNPPYLAKLIFQMPQNKSTKFMDTVIFTLYNYASNQREEYLLLKLFKTALAEEIKWDLLTDTDPWRSVFFSYLLCFPTNIYLKEPDRAFNYPVALFCVSYFVDDITDDYNVSNVSQL